MNMFTYCFVAFLGIFLILGACGIENGSNSLNEDSVSFKEWKNMDMQLKSSVNYAMKMILPAMKVFMTANMTDDCKQQAFHLVLNLKRLKLWALEFVDSSGKMIDGFLSGTSTSPGNYDQCINSVATRYSHQEQKSKVFFRGKYCLLEVKPPQIPPELSPTIPKGQYENLTKSFSEVTKMMLSKADFLDIVGLHFAICIPSGCTINDLKEILQSVNEVVPLRVGVRHCELKKTGWPRDVMIIVGCCGYIAFLVCIGTCLEYYSSCHNRKFKNKGLRMLLAFSLQNNLRRLVDVKERRKLPYLEGIRFLSMLWIMGCHTYVVMFFQLYMHANANRFFEYVSQVFPQIISNGAVAVETFFLIGGLVNYYSRATESDSKRKETNILDRLRHRLFRILPAYALSMMFVLLILQESSGPHGHLGYNMTHNCYNNWWKNMLFINNFQLMSESCMPNSWYLAADMQFFIVALFTIPILLRWSKIGILLNAFVVLSSVCYSGIYAWMTSIPAAFTYGDVQAAVNYANNEHSRPFNHAAAYFIGILTGHFLIVKKDLKIPRKYQIIFWSLSTVFCLSAIFGLLKWNQGLKVTVIENVLFSSLRKALFALGVAIVIVCCSTGHGGIVNSILSCKVWIPLSRLNLLLYLISPTIQTVFIYSSRTLPDTSYIVLVRNFISDSIISIAVAAVIFIFAENPLISLERVIFSKSVKEKKTNEQVSAEVNSNGCLQKHPEAVNGSAMENKL